ncbi:MAG: hypothetical protein F6K16_38935, partial [Symploca sp. SIO2B6]|nr:hypothetical protein [Symploca sp. SIO2B6]
MISAQNPALNQSPHAQTHRIGRLVLKLDTGRLADVSSLQTEVSDVLQ